MARSSSDRLILIVSALALAAVPFFQPNAYVVHVLTLCLLFGVLASSWNLIVGFGGIFTFGHQAFFGLGAYGSALIAMRAGLDPWISVPLGALIAGAAGFLIGLPLLRIKSIAHVAIVSLAFAEIVRITASNLTDLTRGELGLWGIPQFSALSLPGVGEVSFAAANKTNLYIVVLVFAVIAVAAIDAIVRSRSGLALKAIRDNDDAAESLGVNLARYKLLAFTVGAFFAGATGAFYAHYVGILTPHAVMDLSLMIQLVAITLIGGLGTVAGPMLGAFLLIGGLELLRDVSDYRLVIYGVLLVVVITFMPEGVLVRLKSLFSRRRTPDRPEPTKS